MFELVFITSNNIKLSHARFLCRHYEIHISKQKHYGVGYEEPKIQNREELLKESLHDAFKRWKKNVSAPEDKFFFIEDTSVIIPSLSQERPYPGVDIKYWMEENEFEAVDSQLKAKGNDRSVEVRSDIVLMLPQQLQILIGEKFKRFTSGITGKIVDNEIDISTQPLYPWLDSKTFNKWFVPEGCKEPISLLPIEEAEKHDFRAKAFEEMLCFLEKYKLINKRGKPKFLSSSSLIKSRQNDLFYDPLLFIICGPTCSGKTTIAYYVLRHYLYYHIEASDYMYLSYYRHHGVGSNVEIGDFAEKALNDNIGVVVNQIILDIAQLKDIPIIITGFRSQKEIDIFKLKYSGNYQIEVIFVGADETIRYIRSVNRQRSDSKKTRAEFDVADQQQRRMGIDEIHKQYAKKTIINNSTLEEYFRRFEERYHEHLSTFKSELNEDVTPLLCPQTQRLEDEIILSLHLQPQPERYFTTKEIADLINRTFDYNQESSNQIPKSKNNVSRYFNKDYHPYYEIKLDKRKKKYRLSQSGIGRAYWLLRLIVK